VATFCSRYDETLVSEVQKGELFLNIGAIIWYRWFRFLLQVAALLEKAIQSTTLSKSGAPVIQLGGSFLSFFKERYRHRPCYHAEGLSVHRGLT